MPGIASFLRRRFAVAPMGLRATKPHLYAVLGFHAVPAAFAAECPQARVDPLAHPNLLLKTSIVGARHASPSLGLPGCAVPLSFIRCLLLHQPLILCYRIYRVIKTAAKGMMGDARRALSC